MRVLLEGGTQEYDLQGPPLARGGEAAVHALPGDPARVAKIYHHPTAEHATKLAVLLAKGPPDASAHPSVAWPTGRLLAVDDGWRVVGCLMPRVANARPVCELYNPRARRRTCPLFHYGYLLRTARNLAAAVQGLHERGYVVGDLNESNVLVTPRALVTLVDVDSFQLASPGRVHRCGVGKADYTPPELQGSTFTEIDRGPEHDVFALGVLIFQLLMQGTHPFAGMFTGAGEPAPIPERIRSGHWPYALERVGLFQPVPHAPPLDVLPPSVRELFVRCFEEGHAQAARRPSAAAWQEALDEAGTKLALCSTNPQHCYPRGLDVCPWCVLARQHDHDPFPSPTELKGRLLTRLAAGSALEPTVVAEGEAPRLDPDDPLPPRPTPAPVLVPVAVAAPAPVPVPAGNAPSSGGWAPWIAAGALGALLGVLVVVWRYQPAPHVQAASADIAASLEQKREAVATAEHAFQEALQEAQKAKTEYDALEKEYMTKVASLPPNPANQVIATAHLTRMRALLQSVRDKEHILAEKRRLLAEARQALSSKTP